MKKTRLNEFHKKIGAKMIEFFGWEMPVEYSGIIDEHLAVRTRAGLFDVSHMGEVFVTGREALAFVQRLTPNDAARLGPGQVQYTALTTPEGTFVDDMLVYCVGPEEYLLVVNASNADKDYAWIVDHRKGFAVETENRSEAYSQIAFQGPEAEKVLQPLTDIDLAGMKSFHFAFGKCRRNQGPRFAHGVYGRGRIRNLHDGSESGRRLGGDPGTREAVRGSSDRTGGARYAETRGQAHALRERHLG